MNGWIEPQLNRFLVQGYLQGCIGILCARADALVSNLGVAGCLDLGVDQVLDARARQRLGVVGVVVRLHWVDTS